MSMRALAVLLVVVTGCSKTSTKNDGGGAQDGSSPTGEGGMPLGDGAVTPEPDGFLMPTGSTLAIDLKVGPTRQFQPPTAPTKISPYVYGINAFAILQTTTKYGLARQGGDAFTPYNWASNYTNSGADYCFYEGQQGGGAALAGAITSDGFSIPMAQAAGVAYLATVPIVDHVASNVSNNTGLNMLCPGTVQCSSGSMTDVGVNSGNLDFATKDANSTAFVSNNAAKGSTLCTCQPTGTCASGCNVSATGPVYQDEFANFLKVTYGAGASPIFLSLDNEPNYWPSTHPELYPYTGTLGCGTQGTVSFDDIVTRDTTYATALKKAFPATKIFAPVVAQDGIIYAGDYEDSHLPTPFTDYYLGKMATASQTAGVSLLDELDVHYYTSNGTQSQCAQIPRMFWDPKYTDLSAADTDKIDFQYSGANNYFDTDLYPRQMIPRLLGKIATAYAGKGTAPGLSFSEYNAGCEQMIEGGVAEADLLGIFGREGVFAATAWPLEDLVDGNKHLISYLVAAYDLYRNYDGKGMIVGDTSVAAATFDVKSATVYAFTHSDDGTKAEVVAINKTSAALPVTIHIANAPAFTTAAAYQLVDGTVAVTAVPTPTTVSCTGTMCQLSYTLPALSATTLALR